MTDLQPFDTSEIPLINQAIRLAEEIRLGEGIDDQELMKARGSLLNAAAKHLIYRASIVGYTASEVYGLEGLREMSSEAARPFDGYIQNGELKS